MIGTQTQWINLLVAFWWLSPYSESNLSIVRIFVCLKFKINVIGKSTSSITSATNVISLPFNATSIDFTISRGVTGSGSTSVYYRAYGSAGGSGGSFVL